MPAADQEIVSQWQREDWPTIVRRADANTASDAICLGIAVAPEPESGHKRKLAINATLANVAKQRLPLPLSEVIAAAPAAWRRQLAHLDAALPGLRVFGSLALQALTAQAYVGARSDIDLLFAPLNADELRKGLEVLDKFAHDLPLDGEILFPNHEAVSWKEWMIAEPMQARVLVKSDRVVRLARCTDLLSTFGA